MHMSCRARLRRCGLLLGGVMAALSLCMHASPCACVLVCACDIVGGWRVPGMGFQMC